jgi:hypothetical protein
MIASFYEGRDVGRRWVVEGKAHEIESDEKKMKENLMKSFSIRSKIIFN